MFQTHHVCKSGLQVPERCPLCPDRRAVVLHPQGHGGRLCISNKPRYNDMFHRDRESLASSERGASLSFSLFRSFSLSLFMSVKSSQHRHTVNTFLTLGNRICRMRSIEFCRVPLWDSLVFHDLKSPPSPNTILF